MPRVSVIVPCYNHAAYLPQRMESLLAQTYRDFELILLDDASTDDSPRLLRRYGSHHEVTHLVFNDANSGSPFSQWQRGLALASGEWVWIAESDDWSEPDFLERMVGAVGTHPSAGLAFCHTEYIAPDGTPIWCDPCDGRTTLHSGPLYARQTLALRNAIVNASGTLIRRTLLQQADWSQVAAMRLCGDWLLYTQLALAADVLELSLPLNHCRRHPANTSLGAEARGLTFIEGASVLELVIGSTHLPVRRYARPWGRQWAKYERQYGFTPEVQRAIGHRLRRHPAIRVWHLLYQMKHRLCPNHA